jgi:ABC-type multidrug transport system fused ATPase/permease subunit
LVGASGTGKSTLFNLLTKLAEPDEGELFIDGQLVSSMNFKDIQTKMSYVTQ